MFFVAIEDEVSHKRCGEKGKEYDNLSRLSSIHVFAGSITVLHQAFQRILRDNSHGGGNWKDVIVIAIVFGWDAI